MAENPLHDGYGVGKQVVPSLPKNDGQPGPFTPGYRNGEAPTPHAEPLPSMPKIPDAPPTRPPFTKPQQ
jgi:hypothetical protein